MTTMIMKVDDVIKTRTDKLFGGWQHHYWWAMVLDQEGRVTLMRFVFHLFDQKRENGGKTMTQRYVAKPFMRVKLLKHDGAPLMGEEDLQATKIFLCATNVLDFDEEITNPPLTLA